MAVSVRPPKKLFFSVLTGGSAARAAVHRSRAAAPSAARRGGAGRPGWVLHADSFADGPDAGVPVRPYYGWVGADPRPLTGDQSVAGYCGVSSFSRR